MDQLRVSLLCALLALTNCAEERKPKKPAGVERLGELEAAYTERLGVMASLRDAETGWPSRKDCDAMIWAGKYSCAVGAEVNILAAENLETLGRFHRRPAPYCWTPEEGDVGSKTTWSRDMGIGGLFPYAWCNKDLAAMERHGAYGGEKFWKMGEPLADGRVLYTPSMISNLYELIFAIGGEDSANRAWPSVYPAGLVDYEAHLQVMAIWLRAEIAEARDSADALPRPPAAGMMVMGGVEYAFTDLLTTDYRLLNVSESMFQRLVEHRDRQPNCPLYEYMVGVYAGNLNRAVDVLLNPNWTCDYVRGHDLEQIRTAEWLFVANLLMERLKK